MNLAAETLTLQLSGLDIALLVIYFGFVLGIGFALRRLVTTSADFFLSGRSLPAWVTGIAFISANLGAIEILGMAASGAQYGISIVHYYWIGAVPAMIFLGVVMMPFYYGSKVRSVPEYLVRRYDRKTHLVNAIIFVLSSILIAGVNLYALAAVLDVLLGIPLPIAIVVSALFVLSYILLGGLTSAIYNEVMQFFVICAGLIPIVIVALTEVGGIGGLFQKLSVNGPNFTHPWSGLGFGGDNPIGDWVGLVFGLSFCLSFGYWTTNFAEVQRALSAKNMSAARRTPIIGAFPKLFIPVITVLPGLIAVVTVKGLGAEEGDLVYNNAIPLLMRDLLPNGVLGVAVTGLVASFMAGMAANVSGFNTVFTYDIWQAYVRRDRSDEYYLKIGRFATIGGIVVGIGTAFIAAGFSNIMNYIQTLFSLFNAPLFATFIVGMFWKRMTAWAGFWSLLTGTAASLTLYLLYLADVVTFNSDLQESFWGAGLAFVTAVVVAVGVTLVTEAKPEDQLRGLVYGLAGPTTSGEVIVAGDKVWWRNPVLLGAIAVGLAFLLYIPVW